ncbi:MAG: helix-turn-helix domain-containing protein [Fusicatenibacter sp.]|nr:AraC family transcriptional regulator [Fusicatenibacter sp.]
MYFTMNSRFLPLVRLVDRTALGPSNIHKKRTPHEYIIYLVTKGELFLAEDGIPYHLKAGDFMMFHPELYQEGRRVTSCEYYYIHFDHPEITFTQESDELMRNRMLEIRKEALRSDACCRTEEQKHDLIIPKHYHFQDESVFPGLCRMLSQIHSENINHMENYKALCACSFLEFLITVSRQYLSEEIQKCGSASSRSYQKVLEVLGYLHNNYGESISGDSLEEKFNCNFDYLNRIFRQNIGKPIFQYLSELRINHAKELITTTSMRVTQISERVGFVDESYFSKVFKRQTGISPTDYAKTVLRR